MSGGLKIQILISVITLLYFIFPGSVYLSELGCLSVPSDKTPVLSGDTIPKTSQLDKDESLNCTRQALLDMEFYAKGTSKYGELLRITFQDLERGGREILFQKKLMENEEVKFYIPFETAKEAKTAVLIVCKGSGMYFKKIELKD